MVKSTQSGESEKTSGSSPAEPENSEKPTKKKTAPKKKGGKKKNSKKKVAKAARKAGKKTSKKAAKKTGKRGRGRRANSWTIFSRDRLKSLKKKLGYSNSALADALGVTGGSVQAWLKNPEKAPVESTQQAMLDLEAGKHPTGPAPSTAAGSPSGPGVTQQLQRLTPETTPDWLSSDVAAACSRIARELLELAQRVPHAAASFNKAAALVLQAGSND